jgi:hypothetical protein
MHITTRLVLIFAIGAALEAAYPQTHRPGAEPLSGFDVMEKSIDELQAAMEAGRVTSRGLVEIYLARIATYDKQGERGSVQRAGACRRQGAGPETADRCVR